MLRFSPVALIGALTCLVYSHQSNAAVGVAPSVGDSLLLESVVNPCITAGVMVGTAACGIMATNTVRPVSRGGKIIIGGALTGVGMGLGDVDYLGLEDALLRIEARASEAQKKPDEMTRRNVSAAQAFALRVLLGWLSSYWLS